MKKLFLCFTLAFISLTGIAQETHKVYCEIVGTGKFLSTKVKVQIDLGQYTSYFGQNKTFLVDDLGNKLEFNSMVDTMNYLSKLGWKFEQAYVITESGANGQNVYHWLLSKDIRLEEEIREGIMTMKDFEDAKKKNKEEQNPETKDSHKKKVPLFKRNMSGDETRDRVE